MTIEALGRNGGTVNRITGKAANATSLLKRLTNRKGGMKEENLTRHIFFRTLPHSVRSRLPQVDEERKEQGRRPNPEGLQVIPRATRYYQHEAASPVAPSQHAGRDRRSAKNRSVGTTVVDQGRKKDRVQTRHRVSRTKGTKMLDHVPDHVRRNVLVYPLPRNMHPTSTKAKDALEPRH